LPPDGALEAGSQHPLKIVSFLAAGGPGTPLPTSSAPQTRRLGCCRSAHYARASQLQRTLEPPMLVVTTENVPGHRVREAKGQVFGVVVRSRGLGGNILAGLRSLVGGEIKEYTELLELTRRQAIDRMVKNARLMQADAVVMMRFDSSEIGQTMSEIVAYGTAVILEKVL
jgi:uncharacterized protein YbjQ (UPF0145 family)